MLNGMRSWSPRKVRHFVVRDRCEETCPVPRGLGISLTCRKMDTQAPFFPSPLTWCLSLNRAFTHLLGERGQDLLPILGIPPPDPQSSGTSRVLLNPWNFLLILFFFLPDFQALFLPKLPACMPELVSSGHPWSWSGALDCLEC